MNKSLNQLYKESGTTLTYKEWRKREDAKMASFSGLIPSPPSPSLQDSSQYKSTLSQMAVVGGVKVKESGNTIFGINKYIVIIGGFIIVGAIAYKIYKKNHK